MPRNERGLWVGEDHPGAKYSDSDVALVFELRESGMSYGQIAQKMEIPKSTIRDWLKYYTRTQS